MQCRNDEAAGSSNGRRALSASEILQFIKAPHCMPCGQMSVEIYTRHAERETNGRKAATFIAYAAKGVRYGGCSTAKRKEENNRGLTWSLHSCDKTPTLSNRANNVAPSRGRRERRRQKMHWLVHILLRVTISDPIVKDRREINETWIYVNPAIRIKRFGGESLKRISLARERYQEILLQLVDWSKHSTCTVAPMLIS
jgi:hypothetical protein